MTILLDTQYVRDNLVETDQEITDNASKFYVINQIVTRYFDPDFMREKGFQAPFIAA